MATELNIPAFKSLFTMFVQCLNLLEYEELQILAFKSLFTTMFKQCMSLRLYL